MGINYVRLLHGHGFGLIYNILSMEGVDFVVNVTCRSCPMKLLLLLLL